MRMADAPSPLSVPRKRPSAFYPGARGKSMTADRLAQSPIAATSRVLGWRFWAWPVPVIMPRNKVTKNHPHHPG